MKPSTHQVFDLLLAETVRPFSHCSYLIKDKINFTQQSKNRVIGQVQKGAPLYQQTPYHSSNLEVISADSRCQQ